MERYTALFASLSPLGIGLAALAIIVVGSLWYSTLLFGKSWMRHSGIRSTDISIGDARRGYIYGSLVALIQAFLVAIIVKHADAHWHMFVGGIAVLWLFLLLEQFNRFIWERATLALVLIHAFRALATLMAAAFTYYFVS